MERYVGARLWSASIRYLDCIQMESGTHITREALKGGLIPHSSSDHYVPGTTVC